MLRPAQPLRGRTAALVLVTGFALGYILYPLLAVGRQSLSSAGGDWSLRPYLDLLFVEWSRGADGALWGSLWTSLASVVGSALLGIGLGLLLGGPGFPAQRLLRPLLVLPMTLPPLVGVLAFQRLFCFDPFWSRWTGWPPLEGLPLVLAVHIYSFHVYFYLFTLAGLRQLDPSLVEAARGLGASPWQAFRGVVLPALRPHWIAAGLIAFMAAMASFTAPFVFATGQLRVLTVEIQVAAEAGAHGRAAVQSVLLACVCLAFMFLLRRVGGGEGFRLGGKGVARLQSRRRRSGPGWIAFALATGWAVLASLPHWVVLYLALVEQPGVGEVFTLRHFQALLGEGANLRPVLNSLRLALAATACILLLALVAGYLLGRTRLPGRAGLDLLLMLPLALPGTVVGFSLLMAFNEPSWLAGGAVLAGSSGILLLAYVIRHLPLALRPTRAAFQELDPSLEEAARGLGAGGLQTLGRVLLPCVWPSLLAGGLLGFVSSLGEFVSSILLYSRHNEPLSISIWQRMGQYQIGEAAACGVLLMLISGASLAAYAVLSRYQARG